MLNVCIIWMYCWNSVRIALSKKPYFLIMALWIRNNIARQTRLHVCCPKRLETKNSIHVSKKDPFLSSNEIRNKIINDYGVNTSARPSRRYLNEVSLRWCNAQQKALASLKNRQHVNKPIGPSSFPSSSYTCFPTIFSPFSSS